MNTLNQKISLIQQRVGKMTKDKDNPYFKSKYFDLNQILDALHPLEKEYKLTITQPLGNVAGRPSLKLVIEDNENSTCIINEVTLPDIQDPQKMGSAVSYYRRYSLTSFFKLQAEDDDGNFASKPTVKQKVAKMEEEDDGF